MLEVLQYHCRFSDPATQHIMMRLKSDCTELIDAGIDGHLDQVDAEWDRRVALGVVLAAAGYPDNPRRDDMIHGLPERPGEDVHVFHAGTTEGSGANTGHVVTGGGRVLCATALGDTVKLAQNRAYELAESIRFDGLQMRHDIGHRAIKR